MITDSDNVQKLPYRHQEYPKWMNHHDDKPPKLVKNAAEEKAAIANGWSITPTDDQIEAKAEKDAADEARQLAPAPDPSVPAAPAADPAPAIPVAPATAPAKKRKHSAPKSEA